MLKADQTADSRHSALLLVEVTISVSYFSIQLIISGGNITNEMFGFLQLTQ